MLPDPAVLLEYAAEGPLPYIAGAILFLAAASILRLLLAVLDKFF